MLWSGRCLSGRSWEPDAQEKRFSMPFVVGWIGDRGSSEESSLVLFYKQHKAEQLLHDSSREMRSARNAGAEASPFALAAYRMMMSNRRKTVLDWDESGRAIAIKQKAEVAAYFQRFDEAESLYRRALAGKEAVLGADHLETLKAVNNLALCLKKQGKADEAEPLYRRALEGWERNLGVEHPSTLTRAAGS